MAKNRILIIYCIWLAVLNGACVSRDKITDTPPEVAESVSLQPYTTVYTYDTVQVNFAITKKPNSKKLDTVKTIVVQPKIRSYEEKCMAVRRSYLRYIGRTEATGHNDGAWVQQILASVGLKGNFAYCAAGLHFNYSAGGVSTKITAWSPTSFNAQNPVWYKRKFIKQPHVADAVSFYYPSMGRIGHCGFWDKEHGNGLYESVEFNTGGSTAFGIVREGDGCFRKIRSYNATFAISRHINE